VGLVTALTMWQAPRFAPRVPPAIAGLAAGAAAHHALAASGATLGPVIGPLPSVVPTLYAGDFLALPARLAGWGDAAVLATAALSVAIVASLDALLCAKTVEGVTGHRPSGNRELVYLGVGNAVGAAGGAVAGGVNLASSFAAFRAGGRTGLTGVVSGLTVLAAVLTLRPVIALIPRAVIAGMLTVVSLQLLDRWSMELARRMIGGRLAHWRRVTVDLAVVVVVAVVAVAVDLAAAVGIGVAVSVVSFLTRMSRSIVRRSYRGDVIHSRKARDPERMAALGRLGRQTLVLELDGQLFFGTAEALARQVEHAVRADVTCVILDMKRVNEMDATGGRILRQIDAAVRRTGGHLLLSHVPVSGRLGSAFHDHGVVAAVGPDRIFPDTDRALEWAEDRLLAGEGGRLADGELPLARMHVCAGLSPEQCAVLEAMVERRVYPKGAAVMEEGDRSGEVYLIARGAASASVHVAGPGRDNRLATFAAGTVFGEMALLDEAPRSATVRADDELVCYVLSREGFARLTRDHDAIAITLLANLARELSARLRRANRAIAQLEG
jgi:MFS superfamily sulfate permease-like transporter/CRP-like cAMP-binding protein